MALVRKSRIKLNCKLKYVKIKFVPPFFLVWIYRKLPSPLFTTSMENHVDDCMVPISQIPLRQHPFTHPVWLTVLLDSSIIRNQTIPRKHSYALYFIFPPPFPDFIKHILAWNVAIAQEGNGIESIEKAIFLDQELLKEAININNALE